MTPETSPKLRFPEFDGSWSQSSLKDISTKITDGTHDTPKVKQTGVPYITAIHVKDGSIDYDNCYYLDESDHQVIFKRCNPEKGDLLLVNIGAGTATTALVKVDYEFSLKNVALIKPNKELVDSKFLEQSLRMQSQRLFHQLTSGGAQPFLSLKQISKLKTPLTSIEEQQKIADFLTSVDKKISLLKEKHALLCQYKKGVMQKLFKQEIRFKDDNGSDFPDWQSIPLSKLASKNSVKNKDESVNTVLTNSAKDGIVNQGDYFKKDIANQQNLGGYTVVEKNDFVYNPRISELAPVGPIKRNHIGQGVMSPLYTVFRFKDESLLDYLEKYFNTTMWHRYMHSIANFGARHDRMNITTSDFYALPLPIPSEEERAKIISFVNALEAKVNAVKQQIELTQTLKKGLLQQMFV